MNVSPEIELIFSVQQFLFREARLLDDRDWAGWLSLWTEDATYRIPTRHTPLRSSLTGRRSIEDELAGETDLWWIDESAGQIALRVAKMATGKAWAEDPPSRTRRMITNVEATRSEDGTIHAHSNFLLHRSRRERDTELIVGSRRDQLVPSGDDARNYRIASRLVIIDANVLASSDLAVFL